MFWTPVDGNESPELLWPLEGGGDPSSFTPDGNTLSFYQSTAATGADVWTLSLGSEPTARPLLNGPFNERVAVFSPDGDWIAYVSDESGRDEVYVQPYPGPGRKWAISTAGGREPVWSHDGRELFFRNGEQMLTVDVEIGESFALGQPRVLFEAPYDLTSVSNQFYDVAPNGERFVMIQRVDDPPTETRVVLNAIDEIRRRSAEE